MASANTMYSTNAKLAMSDDFNWWDHEFDDRQTKKCEIIPEQKIPKDWDDEDYEPAPITGTKLSVQIPPIITVKSVENTESDDTDSENDSDDNDDDDDTVQIPKPYSDKVPAKKQSKTNDKEKINNLLDKLMPHIKKNKNSIDSSVYTVAKQGYVSCNLTSDKYMVPGYGYLIIFLKKAEAYYYGQGTKKVNISRLRNDIDITKTNLRIALAKQDTQLQQKLCDKLIEQKKTLDDAMEIITDIEHKNTPLDYVKAAIRIVRKNNDRSLKFVYMFRDRVCTPIVHVVSEVEFKDTQTIHVVKQTKPSVFGKKTLVI